MENVSKVIGAVTIAALILLVIAALFALPVMWLWNWLMPAIFGLTKIGFWQALGLKILTGLLFRNSNNYNKKD